MELGFMKMVSFREEHTTTLSHVNLLQITSRFFPYQATRLNEQMQTPGEKHHCTQAFATLTA
jgi:hypothetical protein